jgi:hypothetical protein
MANVVPEAAVLSVMRRMAQALARMAQRLTARTTTVAGSARRSVNAAFAAARSRLFTAAAAAGHRRRRLRVHPNWPGWLRASATVTLLAAGTAAVFTNRLHDCAQAMLGRVTRAAGRTCTTVQNRWLRPARASAADLIKLSRKIVMRTALSLLRLRHRIQADATVPTGDLQRSVRRSLGVAVAALGCWILSPVSLFALAGGLVALASAFTLPKPRGEHHPADPADAGRCSADEQLSEQELAQVYDAMLTVEDALPKAVALLHIALESGQTASVVYAAKLIADCESTVTHLEELHGELDRDGVDPASGDAASDLARDIREMLSRLRPQLVQARMLLDAGPEQVTEVEPRRKPNPSESARRRSAAAARSRSKRQRAGTRR